MLKGVYLRLVLTVLVSVLFMAFSVPGANAGHPAVTLKTHESEIINPLSGKNSEQPYSPKQTCGTCHDYDVITRGYHFQQGWDVIGDDFNSEKPFIKSDGMLGKW